MSDRRNPSPQSFDVLAPDGYLHALLVQQIETDDETDADLNVGLQWNIGVEAPPTTMTELFMGAMNEIALRGGGLITWWRAVDARSRQAGGAPRFQSRP